MSRHKTLAPEMKALYDRIGRLYNAGLKRVAIMAELGIDNETYRRAYSYLYFFKMIAAAKRPRRPGKPKASASPHKPAVLPLGQAGQRSNQDSAPEIAEFIARHGSHVCRDRFSCTKPGVHLVTRTEGASDFARPDPDQTHASWGWRPRAGSKQRMVTT